MPDEVSRPVGALPYRLPFVAVGARRIGGSGRGAELVTNGAFTTDLTGWTAFSTGTGTATWSAGTLNVTGTDSTTNRGAVHQTITCAPGVLYEVTFTAAITSGSGAFLIGTSPNASGQVSSTVTAGSARTFTFNATQTSHVITLRNSGAGGNVDFDNVSVKAIL